MLPDFYTTSLECFAEIYVDPKQTLEFDLSSDKVTVWIKVLHM